MRSLITATIAAVAVASVSSDCGAFPGDAWNHAGCHVDATFTADCATVYAAMSSIITSWNPEPLETPGYYSIKSQVENDCIWSTRLTYNKKYTDDQLFLFSESNGTCTVTGRSRSESVSMLDNGVNYCNLWNVYQAVGGDSIVNVSDCSVEPSNPVENCARY